MSDEWSAKMEMVIAADGANMESLTSAKFADELRGELERLTRIYYGKKVRTDLVEVGSGRDRCRFCAPSPGGNANHSSSWGNLQGTSAPAIPSWGRSNEGLRGGT